MFLAHSVAQVYHQIPLRSLAADPTHRVITIPTGRPFRKRSGTLQYLNLAKQKLKNFCCNISNNDMAFFQTFVICFSLVLPLISGEPHQDVFMKTERFQIRQNSCIKTARIWDILQGFKKKLMSYPIGSMYDIFTYIWLIFMDYLW